MNNAFLGFVRMVKEENVAEKYKGKSNLGAVHLWREDLPNEIKVVLNEYEDVFPKDLPPGLLPICSRLPLEGTLDGRIPKKGM